VQRSDNSVRVGEKKLRRRVAKADRACGRAVRKAVLPGQPAGHLRHRVDRGAGGQRVPRQLFAGGGLQRNTILFPE